MDESKDEICEVEEKSIEIQGLTFKLIKGSDGNFTTEKPWRRKIDIQEMRALIEEMVSKGFY